MSQNEIYDPDAVILTTTIKDVTVSTNYSIFIRVKNTVYNGPISDATYVRSSDGRKFLYILHQKYFPIRFSYN